MTHRIKGAHLHLAFSVTWAALLIPTLIWWKDSILWVASMSLYANFIGHWAAYQGARAERAARGDGNGGNPEMAVTLDQAYQLLVTINRKLDTLLAEAGIIMSQNDDLSAELSADTQLLGTEVAALNDNYGRLSGLVAQLEAAQGQPVSADVVAGFKSALAGLKPAVDKIGTVGVPAPAPAEPPSPPAAQ